MDSSKTSNEDKQKSVLEKIRDIGKEQSDTNALVFNPKTGEFETVSSDVAAQNDPDQIIISEIATKGWA